MTTFFNQLYIRNSFFLYWVVVVVLFCIGFGVPFLYLIAQVALMALIAITMLDLFILFFTRSKIGAIRVVNARLSLGDKNAVRIKVSSSYNMPVSLRIIDELPYQLQVRGFEEWMFLNPGESKELTYLIQPNKRGVYLFQDINIYVSTILRVAERRITINAKQEAAVYPSILQMKKYELQVFSKTAIFQGIKKIRRLGNNNEFEQIKTYVRGDDIRAVNWKATSRKGELMVNQYQDERSQQVYCVIDKSRSMRMPFDNLTLLDHSINCVLALSNIILRKDDKVGVVTFSDKLGSRLPAENTTTQLRRIIDVLYKQKTRFMESDYERLYFGLRNTIKGRSMVLLFTNFESVYALKRNLPLLRRINQQHLLVVVYFENSELKKASKMESKCVKDIYIKTLAGKFTLEKELIAFELRKYGIQSVLTKPENLSVETINKYLELKSRGMI